MKTFTSTIIVILLLLFISITFVTCSKAYSYEGGLPSTTAVFTVNTCTNAIVSGHYYVDELVDTSHNIQLQVNVTTTGTYYISTNTNNGIMFSATGNFTIVGTQTVVLKASGTPVTMGNYNFLIANNSTCSIPVLVNAKRVKMATFSLVGEPNACTTAIVSGNYIVGKTLVSQNTIAIQINITGTGAYSISTDTLDGIYFSASGNFSNTGNQIVTLTGNGTPDAARNLVFTPKSNTTFCSFPLTILPPEPLAVYVLESGYGTSTPCIYTVNGNYVANTTLTNSNTITMNVFVATAGNFAVVTDTVNGMIFAYSGVFTTTGSQKIVLVGSGTPINTGSFALTPQIIGPHPLGGQFCGISITVN